MASLQACNAQIFTPDENFWPRWRAEKQEMKANGYGVCKIKNKWYVIKVGGQTTIATKPLKNGADEIPNDLHL